MSLYDGLDIDHKDLGSGARRNKSDLAGWSPGFKLLQPQLQNKRTALPPRRRPTSMAPVVDLKGKSTEGEYRFNQQTGKLEKIISSPAPVFSTTPFVGSDPIPSFAGVDNEYNPLYPNDYEDVVKRKRDDEQKQKAVDREKEIEEREKRRKERHREMGYGDDNNENGGGSRGRRQRSDSDDEDESRDRKRRDRGGGAAIAPPTALIEQDEQIKDEVQKEMQLGTTKPSIGLKLGLGGSVAAKLMAKMGYKEGQGLGKSEQGMSQALVVEKTSKRGGKIIHEKDLPKDTPRAADTGSTADLLRNPSKVILLRNMVGPGEVDADLEPETAEECGKYGKVIKCIIFEMPDVEEDEAVRIFVEFEKIDSAIKGVIDLHGRFFGGRSVKGGFYNLDKFRRLDLVGDVQ